MIFADKLIDLRKKNGWSQEELAHKINVSRQSVSKWESAQSIPDIEKIVKLSDLFGVSTDYLLKDSVEETINIEPIKTESTKRKVDMEEAGEFLKLQERNAFSVAIGVMLCILSPICLILLEAAVKQGKIGISEIAASGMGVIILLAFITGAVALFITSGIRVAQFSFIRKEEFETAYGVDSMVKDKREKYKHLYTRRLISGISLCIMSAVPILATDAYAENDAYLSAIFVGITLVLISVGVFYLVKNNVIAESFQKLLQEGSYTPEEKAILNKKELFSTAYWLFSTAVYLALSFYTAKWQLTWIIWPVVAVIYPAALSIFSFIAKSK